MVIVDLGLGVKVVGGKCLGTGVKGSWVDVYE